MNAVLDQVAIKSLWTSVLTGRVERIMDAKEVSLEELLDEDNGAVVRTRRRNVKA